MSKGRLALLVVIACAVVAFFAFGLGDYLNLEWLNRERAALESYRDMHPWTAALVFFVIYVAVTGLSLPGAAVMTLAAGAIFGLLWAAVLVSFASSIGATLAFLASRFLFRESVQGRFGESLRAVNAGVEREGGFYLFTLRLVPLFPFFVINLVFGLTPMRARTFYWVSQIGMLPGTIVYCNAGTQLARIDSLAGIASPALIGSFVLLGVFPLIARRVVDRMKARRVYRGWRRPERFERDMVVVGAGSAGLVAALIAATLRAKVTLIERERMGGDCLNTGCVPSKALIRTAKFLAELKRAPELGIRAAHAEFEFSEVMERVHRVIATIEPHDSVERYTSLGVDCVAGDARITSPWTVEVDGRELTTRTIVIATGAQPFVPPIPGIEEVGYLTSDTVWGLRERPGRLLVLGGGPIGCELTQCFARLGCEVTQVEMLPRILIREDPDVSDAVAERFRAEGIRVLTGHRAKAFRLDGERRVLTAEHDGAEVEIEFDALLVAVGRAPRTRGFGLEDLGVGITKAGTVEVDEYLATRFPNIYACGDVAGPYQFTHTASHQAWYAAVNALFAGVWRFRADYSVIPWTTFTDPEVARVGLNETEAAERGIKCEVSRYGIDDLDRAIADEEAHGFVKVLTAPGRDRVLGATIVGAHAGELNTEFVSAMRHRIGLNKILSTIHVYPTLSEANRFAAGVWKRAHAPEGLLGWVERYHRWRRG